MAALSYMQRRASGTYEFRKRLPESLAGKPAPSHMRDDFSDLINTKTGHFKRELVRSLATKSLNEAKRRDHQAALKASELFDAAVKALAPPAVAVQPVALDLKQLGDDVFASLLANDEAERMEGDDRRHLQIPEDRARWPHLVDVPPSTQIGMTPDHFYAYGELLSDLEDDYRAAYAQRDPKIVYPETTKELQKRGIHLNKSSPEFQKVALVVLEAHVRAYDAMGKRQLGEIIPTPAAVRKFTEESGSNFFQELGPKFSEALASWAAGGSAHNAKKPNANTVTEAEQAFRYFKELHGDLQLGEITREKAREFRDAIAKVPASLPRDLRKLPLPELLKRDLSTFKPRMATTVNKIVQVLGGIVSRAEREGFLDKPMKNHTLMQTIARANRRAPGKNAGVIVDYVGVFQSLQKALAIYAAKGNGGDSPIKDKQALVDALEAALKTAREFCAGAGVDVDAIYKAEKLQRLTLIGQAVETLIAPDDRRRGFFRVVSSAERAYKALLPDDRAAPYLKPVAALHVLAEAVRGKLVPVDISAVAAKIEVLLDEKIDGVAITAPIIEGDAAGGRVDLSAIDFEKLAKLFAKQPRTATETLREEAEETARRMVEQNPFRVQFVEKLENLVEQYNLGKLDVQAFFEALKALIAAMDEEQRRAARENLTEDELAIFDLLTKPEPKLTKAQETAVKKVARELLEKLHDELSVDDWQVKQQTRAAVQSTIRFTLNDLPEEPYPEAVWNEKVGAVWGFIFSHRKVGTGSDRRI